MASPYYVVAYGHAIRISDRVGSPQAAMRDTFGVDSGCTYLKVDGKGWRHLSYYVRQQLNNKVRDAHKLYTAARENGLTKFGDSCDADAVPHAWTAGEREDDES